MIQVPSVLLTYVIIGSIFTGLLWIDLTKLKMYHFKVISAIIVIGLTLPIDAIGPLGTFGVGVASSKCEPSITTASGPYAIHKGSYANS